MILVDLYYFTNMTERSWLPCSPISPWRGSANVCSAFQLCYQNKSCSEYQQDVRKTGRKTDRKRDRQKDRQISDRKTYYYKTHCPICEIINTTNLKTNLSVHMNIYLNTVVRFCFIITLTTWVTHELLLDVPSSKLSVGLNVHIDYISNKFLYGLTRHLP